MRLKRFVLSGSAQPLEPAVIQTYCQSLANRVGASLKAFEQEVVTANTSGANFSPPFYDAAHHFCQQLRETCVGYGFKQVRQLRLNDPIPLLIDVYDNGFPTFTSLWELQGDWEKSAQVLRELPLEEEIARRAVDAIYTGKSPLEQQVALIERQYNLALSRIAFLKDYFQEVQPLPGAPNLFFANFYGVQHSSNRLLCYTLIFEQGSGFFGGREGGREGVEKILRNILEVREDMAGIMAEIDKIPFVSPKRLERLEIGPYYHSLTENYDMIDNAFAGVKDPYILYGHLDWIVSAGTQEASFWERQNGRETETLLPAQSRIFAIVPLAIKQSLIDQDPDGDACSLYGVTANGDVVQ